ncbi:hypothetical protein C2845_PM16G02820 [Panicum miliaceum]|uniref:Uncharacterized protein n=1 Tax=Panicum miliaceum TaxID=4540 RepID=A0A3L6PUG2_PANMI|nr:hypothetical protein C2845_PM16G02820 [Panicum miliaceum]
MEEETQQMVHEQPQLEVDGNEDEVGGEMTIDQAELDETIVEEMVLDDDEYRTFVGGRDGMANLELIDPVIDVKHRSHLVDGQLPPVLRLRTHDECWRLDACWIPRYDKSGYSIRK